MLTLLLVRDRLAGCIVDSRLDGCFVSSIHSLSLVHIFWLSSCSGLWRCFWWLDRFVVLAALNRRFQPLLCYGLTFMLDSNNVSRTKIQYHASLIALIIKKLIDFLKLNCPEYDFAQYYSCTFTTMVNSQFLDAGNCSR